MIHMMRIRRNCLRLIISFHESETADVSYCRDYHVSPFLTSYIILSLINGSYSCNAKVLQLWYEFKQYPPSRKKDHTIFVFFFHFRAIYCSDQKKLIWQTKMGNFEKSVNKVTFGASLSKVFSALIDQNRSIKDDTLLEKFSTFLEGAVSSCEYFSMSDKKGSSHQFY